MLFRSGTTTGGVNVRTGESKNYSKIGYLTKSTKVEIVKQASSGWYMIKYNEDYGYVCNKYVELDVDIDNDDKSDSEI